MSGNVEFPATVDVVAHENTKANMEAMRPASFVAQPASGPPPNIFTRNNGTGMAKRTFKDLPGMDANNGRTGVGYVDTLTKAADFADKNNIQTIVNGHHDTTTTRADLREFIQYVRDFVKATQDGKRSGKSVDASPRPGRHRRSTWDTKRCRSRFACARTST